MDIQPYLDEYEQLEEQYHKWSTYKLKFCTWGTSFPGASRLVKQRKLMCKAGIWYIPAEGGTNG